MEVLKVLVVLLVALHGSLSTPLSQNELRSIVRELERLAESLSRYVVDKSGLEYSMDCKDPLSCSTSEFPIPGTRPFGPWGLDNDELDGSSSLYKWLYKIVKPYFRSFPTGPYSSKMSLTPRDVVSMLNTWYNNADQKMLKEKTFLNVARQLLDAHFQCATTRMNQMVFYVFKDQVRRMSEDDSKMTTYVRNVLGNLITNTTLMDEVTQTIVMAARRHAYGDIMEHIQYFQLNDIVEFLANMYMLMWKAEQEKCTPVMFHEKMNQLLMVNDVVFQCPSVHDLWEFHQKIVSRFQKRLSEIKPFTETEAWLKKVQIKPFTETEAWLKKVLSPYRDTDATLAIISILQVYTDYVKSAMLRFQEVENHVTSGNVAQITKFLAPHQLQYLQSIFEFLNSGNTEMGPQRDEL